MPVSDQEYHEFVNDLIELKQLRLGMSRRQLHGVLGVPDKMYYALERVPPYLWRYGNMYFMFDLTSHELIWIYRDHDDKVGTETVLALGSS